MNTSGSLLNVKTIMIGAVFIFLTAVNLHSFTEGYDQKVFLYKPEASNQTMYMPEFLETGMYPDAFIRALVRDKKVAVFSDFIPYVNYPSHGHDHTEDVGSGDVFFSYNYYYDNNYGLLLKKYAGEEVVDEDLPSPFEVTPVLGEPEREKYFTFLGYGNDMLRNAFLVNEDREYVNTYFHYAHTYYYLDEEIAEKSFKVYLSPEDLSVVPELVAIWDSRENLYLMSRNYYNENVKEMF